MIWSADKQLQGGKYEIIREIGSGGYGRTYLAKAITLQRDVAIKTPKQELETDNEYKRFKRRFEREGRALAKVDHQNVVKIIEVFEEEGFPCLVMDYITGPSLEEEILSAGPLPQEIAVNCFRKLADALHYVHQADLIHCDIHPRNIILTSENEPVLIDFGSVKLLQPSTVTVTATVNPFCPYEQGRSEPQVTLDIYGLSATFYFAITGQNPPLSLNRKLFGDRLTSPREIVRQLDEWVEKAILAGMEIEAENRPISMSQWLKALRQPPPQPDFTFYREFAPVNSRNTPLRTSKVAKRRSSTQKESPSDRQQGKKSPQVLAFRAYFSQTVLFRITLSSLIGFHSHLRTDFWLDLIMIRGGI